MITKVGIDTTKFDSAGVGSFNTGLENTYTANVPTALYVLTNKNGTEATITNLGCRLVSMLVADQFGEFRDVVLGFDNIADYADFNCKNNVFGAVIGRFGNRIYLPTFDNGGGEKYKLEPNNGESILHGGPYGWQYQTFDVVEYSPEEGFVKFRLVSPDGDAGFHGEVTFDVTYSLNDNDELTIKYEAVSDEDTLINVTNHSFFNLSGDMSKRAIDQFAYFDSKFTTPIRPGVLPTGEVKAIDMDSTFDFRENGGKIISRDIFNDEEQIKLGDGYDHNFVLAKEKKIDAAIMDLESGIAMSIKSSEPAMQLYTAYHLDGSLVGKNGVTYNSYAGICLETQHFPDGPNFSHFPSCELKAGEKFESFTTYTFSAAKCDGANGQEHAIEQAKNHIASLAN